jgi:putative DNA primase/helicase
VRLSADDAVRAFVAERCKASPWAETSRVRVWEAWAAWCRDSGNNPGTQATLGRRLRAVAGVRDGTARLENGKKTRAWAGIGLRDATGAGEAPRRIDSDVEAFIAERCVVMPGATSRRDEVWSAWVAWCASRASGSGSRAWLGRRLRAAIPLADSVSQAGGKKVRLWAGVALR